MVENRNILQLPYLFMPLISIHVSITSRKKNWIEHGRIWREFQYHVFFTRIFISVEINWYLEVIPLKWPRMTFHCGKPDRNEKAYGYKIQPEGFPKGQFFLQKNATTPSFHTFVNINIRKIPMKSLVYLLSVLLIEYHFFL